MLAFKLEDQLILETWEDITARPRYQACIDSKKFRSYQIEALYSFTEQHACCGVTTCQKKHNRGFLVVYAGDKETNLCEECGFALTGCSYEEQARLVQDRAVLRQQQVRLNAFLEDNENLKDRVKQLKQAPYGANWLYRTLIRFRQTYPAELLAVLTEMENSKVDDAAPDALAEKDISPAQLEEIEQLQGLGIFNADIKEVLIGNILKPLKALEAVISSPESVRSLSRFCKWADKFDEHFAQAETLVDQGRLFFQAENMKRLKSIPLSEKNTKRVRSLRWGKGSDDQG